MAGKTERFRLAGNGIFQSRTNGERIQNTKADDRKRRLAYRAASLEFEEKNAVYEQKRKIFLNAQAGFLAQELKEGCPCPVCGSTEHPSPCKLEEEHQNLTKEMIEELAFRQNSCGGKQEQAARRQKPQGAFWKKNRKMPGKVLNIFAETGQKKFWI